jgi:alpha-galactosidase
MMDVLNFPELTGATPSLMDIDPVRLDTARQTGERLVTQVGAPAAVEATLDQREAVRGAKYVICAVQVGMHRATLTDFDIPRKYGLRQTSGDALGVGGSFRGLRTIPVMFSLLRDMEEVCPDALFLNYVKPSEHPVLGDGASLRYPHRRPLPQRSRDRTSVGQVPRC